MLTVDEMTDKAKRIAEVIDMYFTPAQLDYMAPRTHKVFNPTSRKKGIVKLCQKSPAIFASFAKDQDFFIFIIDDGAHPLEVYIIKAQSIYEYIRTTRIRSATLRLSTLIKIGARKVSRLAATTPTKFADANVDCVIDNMEMV